MRVLDLFLKGLGNAIVPQIVQIIGEAIWDSSGS